MKTAEKIAQITADEVAFNGAVIREALRIIAAEIDDLRSRVDGQTPVADATDDADKFVNLYHAF